jgi:hypothetical protein
MNSQQPFQQPLLKTKTQPVTLTIIIQFNLYLLEKKTSKYIFLQFELRKNYFEIKA